MTFLFKAEMQLFNAESKWPQDPSVRLHLAEVKIHQMDYMSAVHMLRQAYYYISSGHDEDEVYAGDDASIAAMITTLLGMAEFRIAPDNPDVSFVNVIRIIT